MSSWTERNSNRGPSEIADGICKTCDGNRVLYTDFMGEQKTVTCPECKGSGRE